MRCLLSRGLHEVLSGLLAMPEADAQETNSLLVGRVMHRNGADVSLHSLHHVCSHAYMAPCMICN